jgi:short-subunit dehydrogenase
LVQQKGQIVVINSVMGIINTKYRPTNAAAKYGVVGYFESLRLELEESGVHVCNIRPGLIAINISKNRQNNSRLSPENFAQKALKVIYYREGNVYIGSFKEKFAVLLKRVLPTIFDMIIKNQKVT